MKFPVLNMLMIALLTIAIFQPLSKVYAIGGIGTGGGDFVTAINEFLKLDIIEFREELHGKTYQVSKDASVYCQEFKAKAKSSLKSLLTENQANKQTTEGVKKPIEVANRIANGLCNGPTLFELDSSLIDRRGRPLTAVNQWREGVAVVRLNPVRWDFVPLNLGDDDMASEIQALIAGHELLSLVQLESTGFYTYSSINFYAKYSAFKGPNEFLQKSCSITRDLGICSMQNTEIVTADMLGKTIGILNKLRNNSYEVDFQRQLQQYLIRPGMAFWRQAIHEQL